VWSVECSSDKIIIQDANAEVNANVNGRIPRRAVGAAATMEVNEIHGKRMAARPKHLQGATKAKRLDSCGEVAASALKTGANNTREWLIWRGGHTRIT
jgi:hypothetical protein